MSQKGPDGNYHTAWVSRIKWNDIGFYSNGDLGDDYSGGGGGGVYYSFRGGISSQSVLDQMGFGDRFGKNKNGEYGFWSKFVFDGASGDGGVNMDGVGIGVRWESFDNTQWNTSRINYMGFADGNVSTQDKINLGLAFVGANMGTLEALARTERDAFRAKGVVNGMNNYYRRGLKNWDGAVEGFGKYGKKLGIVGAALTLGNLAYKYETSGITRKDIFDGAVSGVLLAITVTNPIGLIGLGIYGLLDASGILYGAKEAVGIDETVVAKHDEGSWF